MFFRRLARVQVVFALLRCLNNAALLLTLAQRRAASGDFSLEGRLSLRVELGSPVVKYAA